MGWPERTIKILYGPSLGCAKPGCTEKNVVYIDGQPVTVTQIAHIRSDVPGGPRHDPTYAKPNRVENLLLLCYPHHKLVDDYWPDYPVARLEEWKAAQIAQFGEQLSDEAVKLIAAKLTAATTVDLEVSAMGSLWVAGAIVPMPLGALAKTRVDGMDPVYYISVSVANRGLVDADITNVGLDLDFCFDTVAGAQVYSPWFFPPDVNRSGPLPVRQLSHSQRSWQQPLPTLAETIRMMVEKAYVLDRLRAFAITGSGQRFEGEWVPAYELPVWRDGFGLADLGEMQERATATRVQLRHQG